MTESRAPASSGRMTLIRWVSVVFLAFYMYQAAFGAVSPAINRSVFIGCGLLLVFLYRPARRGWWVDGLLMAAVVAGTLYFNLHYDRFLRSYGLPLRPMDLVMGTVMLAAVIEAARRQAGSVLASLSVLGLIYLYWGRYFPGTLAHRGFAWNDIVSELYASITGLYGEITYALANYMFLLLAFGAFLNASGAGDFYLKLVQSLLGRAAGGGAKAAVLSSFIAGTVTGSAASNVGITGPITIPLMKRTGFSAAMAGAIEAAASTGGTVLPPVMGAAAFIMTAIVGRSYLDVVKAAAIPGVLYFVSVFLQTHFYAKRQGLRGLPENEVPNMWETLRQGFPFLLPPFVLVWALAQGYSVNRVGLYGIVAAVAVSFYRKDTRMTWRKFSDAMVDAVRTALPILAVAGPVSILAAALLLPGTSVRLAGMLTTLTGGDLLLTILLVGALGFVLGMGLDATAAYMVLAALVPPALVQLGVPLLSAHLILLWYGQVSNITPPVAMAAYAAAAIAEESIWKVGVRAVQVGLGLLYLPLVWAYRPELLLLSGSVGDILLAVAVALAGILFLCAGLEGYLLNGLGPVQRLVALAAGVLLLVPVGIADLVGAVLAAVVLGSQLYQVRFATAAQRATRELSR